MDTWDNEGHIDKLISDYDDTFMPLPDIEFQPHLLISKVRKHYMEYIIKLLSLNYETNQRLLNKNIYLPSAIWRCAKNIEMNAAQTCMVVQLYRKNVTELIKDIKKDTTKGKLNKKLYECLRNAPSNEKKLQTTLVRSKDCTCQCTCSQRKRPRVLESPQKQKLGLLTESSNNSTAQPQVEKPVESQSCPVPQILQISNNANQTSNISQAPTRISVESQDSDELLLQLEKLFQGDPNDDDIFEGTFCDTYDFATNDDNKKIQTALETNSQLITDKQCVIEDHAAQIKSLDERLASLTGLLANNSDNIIQQKQEAPKQKRNSSKWLCEEYFLKVKLHEKLDLIRDTNRKKLSRIKQILSDLFGDDSDDEDVVSPLDETADFVISCKERIAPWVVKLLTPYYIRGRIRGKALFKSLAKHLIRLIYQCSRYPSEYEVQSFVNDFLDNHKMIRCEADFKQFKIDNLATY
ncbi:uncharacterized protein LOC106131672 [Amyelois transitella]|uniref:uncharacterized protein LOC106131672 n=1 Tax=Amyelois transitella TaxID=680683 RepID=UPI00067DB06C|nr:uncharacterized protein LOC106131672 [Amyelois transitella]